MTYHTYIYLQLKAITHFLNYNGLVGKSFPLFPDPDDVIPSVFFSSLTPGDCGFLSTAFLEADPCPDVRPTDPWLAILFE